MTTINDKMEAVKTSLLAHEQGRLSAEELHKLAKVIDCVPTVEEIGNEEYELD